MVSNNAAMAAKQTGAPSAPSKFYIAAWRWHFYAGLYVIPFLAVLAITGMAMAWIAHIGGRDGEYITVTQGQTIMPVSEQAEAALSVVPNGTLKQYVAPRADDLASIFRVDLDGVATTVVVDPYTAEVITSFPRRSGWYDFTDNVHGSLLLGDLGDRLIEIAASLAMVLIATGLYMWWPRQARWKSALIPSLKSRGRGF